MSQYSQREKLRDLDTQGEVGCVLLSVRMLLCIARIGDTCRLTQSDFCRL